MSRRERPRPINPADKEQMDQFRKDLEVELDKALDHHEFKMVYIGIATLAAFAGVIYLSVKYQLPFF
jgi:hypothetical protein